MTPIDARIKFDTDSAAMPKAVSTGRDLNPNNTKSFPAATAICRSHVRKENNRKRRSQGMWECRTQNVSKINTGNLG